MWGFSTLHKCKATRITRATTRQCRDPLKPDPTAPPTEDGWQWSVPYPSLLVRSVPAQRHDEEEGYQQRGHGHGCIREQRDCGSGPVVVNDVAESQTCGSLERASLSCDMDSRQGKPREGREYVSCGVTQCRGQRSLANGRGHGAHSRQRELRAIKTHMDLNLVQTGWFIEWLHGLRVLNLISGP